jgi:hypothetical protein
MILLSETNYCHRVVSYPLQGIRQGIRQAITQPDSPFVGVVREKPTYRGAYRKQRASPCAFLRFSAQYSLKRPFTETGAAVQRVGQSDTSIPEKTCLSSGPVSTNW